MSHPVDDAETIADALIGASKEQLGRECAHRCIRSWEAAAAAKVLAMSATSLMAMADMVDLAKASAAECDDWGRAAMALLGTGDMELVKQVTQAHRDASTHAQVAMMHYQQRARSAGTVHA